MRAKSHTTLIHSVCRRWRLECVQDRNITKKSTESGNANLLEYRECNYSRASSEKL